MVELVNAERTQSVQVKATSLESLRCVAHERLDIGVQEAGVVFFEDGDGTSIEDDEYVLHLEPGSTVMVCRSNEAWQPGFSTYIQYV